MQRREVLQSVGVLALAGMVPAAAWASATPPELFIYDRRFAPGRAAARAIGREGGKRHAIAGDVTGLWRHDLHRRWEVGGCAIAGLTTARSLFCLEQLAHDQGHRVLTRAIIHEGGEPLVAWTIGPRRQGS